MESASHGTLADEFMLDFEEGDGEAIQEEEETPAALQNSVVGEFVSLPTNLRTTPRFVAVMKELDENQGVVDAESFALISKANELAADVSEHQMRISKYIK
jgi:hypothetical protein